jgi:hypothetical protein
MSARGAFIQTVCAAAEIVTAGAQPLREDASTLDVARHSVFRALTPSARGMSKTGRGTGLARIVRPSLDRTKVGVSDGVH